MIIRFTPETDAAHQREDLDLEFMQSIDDALLRIVANPHQYPNVYQSLRRCVVRRFPFAIFYEVASDEVGLSLASRSREMEIARVT